MTEVIYDEAYWKAKEEQYNLSQKRRTLTSREKVEIIERYKAGEAGEALSKAFDVSLPTIYVTLYKAGVKMRPQGRPGLSQEKRDQVRHMVQEMGYTARQVASVLNISAGTVYRIAKEDNVGLRKTNAVLSDEAVRKIRENHIPGQSGHRGIKGTTVQDLAKEHGVSMATIHKVITFQTYRHVGPSKEYLDRNERLWKEAEAAGIKRPKKLGEHDLAHIWQPPE